MSINSLLQIKAASAQGLNESNSLRSLVSQGLENVSSVYTGSGETVQFYDVVGLIISFGLSLVGVFFVVHMIIAGFTWMNAGGDEGKVTDAQDRIKNSVLGIVVVFAAYTISAFVLTQVQTIFSTPLP